MGASAAFLADSGALALGAVFGTSIASISFESAAGIKAGGRTGMMAVVRPNTRPPS